MSRHVSSRGRKTVLVVVVMVLALASLTGCMGTTATSAKHSGHGSRASGTTRTYYVAAVQRNWNYTPSRTNQITGKPFGAMESVFVKRGAGRIGSTYRKCLYREFTDETFRHEKKRPAADGYLGMLGPVLHAAVGDTIRVVFHNTCSFPTTMHPHGVFYTKANEGARYSDRTSGKSKADDAVKPGHTYTYTWEVPERAGPGPADGSSLVWLYHGHTNPVADSYSGLVGPIVVTAPGQAKADGTPKDVDRELFHLFEVSDENQSHYLDHNLHHFAKPPYPDLEDEDFHESNLMHTMNGFVYGNGPVPTMHVGDRVRWYTFSLGTEVDLHTPHWHGNVVTVNGRRTDVVELMPATMVTADMTPDDPGTWFFHCHVDDHIKAGMQSRYRVLG